MSFDQKIFIFHDDNPEKEYWKLWRKELWKYRADIHVQCKQMTKTVIPLFKEMSFGF